MTGASVKLENITVVFNKGTPNEITALKDINLEVASGERMVILGGNGSGKSTLLKVIAGIIRPTEGTIFINGVDVTGQKDYQRARGISYVHQDPLLGTCPSLTLFENLAISENKKWWWPFPVGLKLNGKGTKGIEKAGLGIEKRISMPLSNFSGGQRQVIAINMELSKKVPLVLLDEFTSSLDESTAKNIYSIAFSKSQKEKTLISIIHDLNQAITLQQSIVLIKNGKIIQNINKKELKSISIETISSMFEGQN